MPTLYKRGSYWWACIWVNGKPNYRSTKEKTKNTARKRLQELELELKGIQLSKLYLEWLGARFVKSDFTKVGRETGISVRYAMDVQKFLNYFIVWYGDKSAGLVTQNDILKYERHLTLKGYSAASIGISMRTLKVLFSFAHSKGLINKNPFKGYRIPAGKPRTEYLEKHQVEEFLEVVDRPLVREYFRFMIRTGIRVGEMLNLRWEDVNSNFIQFDGKAGKRHFPLLPEIKTVLDTIQELQGGRNTGRILVSEKGQYLGHYHNFTKCAKRYFKKAGLDHMCLYGLRHTFATLLLLDGVDLFKVSKLMGHKLVSTTQRNYEHVLSSRLKVEINF